MTNPLLAVSGLTKRYSRGGKIIAAVDDVSFHIEPGETLALAGPSGSGKSTIARLILRLIEADSGQVEFEGSDFLSLNGAALRDRRVRLQMVFQDPLAALNPRATVARVLDDP
ncbi:MAG: ATP-binding cassette domain-containing protein, partial [Mesorhizobium sp.]